MVVRLNPPAIDDDEYTQAVIDERMNGRNAQYFTDNSLWWKGRIAEYNREQGNPVRIVQSVVEAEHRDKYINLYASSQREQRQVQEITRLRKRKPRLLLCPACGEDGTPRTLDHYLPKSTFPEYAVHLKNLVPMCDICQGTKGEEYLSEEGEKLYFHAYFDPIPEGLFFVEISPPYNAPAGFTLRVTNPGDALSDLALRHAAGLDMQSRVEDFCVEKYGHLLKSVSTNRTGANMPVRDLIGAFLINEEQKSSNSWPAMFYRSVLANAELMDYLATGVLPGHYST